MTIKIPLEEIKTICSKVWKLLVCTNQSRFYKKNLFFLSQLMCELVTNFVISIIYCLIYINPWVILFLLDYFWTGLPLFWKESVMCKILAQSLCEIMAVSQTFLHQVFHLLSFVEHSKFGHDVYLSAFFGVCFEPLTHGLLQVNLKKLKLWKLFLYQ